MAETSERYAWGRESKVRNSKGEVVEAERITEHYINRNNDLYHAITLTIKAFVNHIK